MATVKDLRKKYVKTAAKYIGAKQGSKKHRKIVDTFNSVKPGGQVMNYVAPWCAASVTAWAIETFGKKDAAKAFPLDYNCGRLIDQARKLGGWKESDTFKPSAGDLIIFNWDAQAGEVKSGADHVGVVEKVADGYIHTIEGNYSSVSQVGRRTFPIGWRYIRGFIVPQYGKIADLSDGKTQPSNSSTKPKNPATHGKSLPAGAPYRVNTVGGLNVRKGAGVNYIIKTAIPNGTTVYITKSKNGWAYSKQLDGWMFFAYLKKI